MFLSLTRLWKKHPRKDHLLCVVGLGNPGEKYLNNRHNIGFQVADRYAERLGIPVNRNGSRMRYGTAVLESGIVSVCKPMTFMNRSGDAVSELIRKYQWEPDTFLIVYDDVSLPAGTLRIRLKGSSGGHNGLQSIIDSLGTANIARLRFGVGPPDRSQDLADYVLSDFAAGQSSQIEAAIERACDAIEFSLVHGMERTMNVFNSEMKTNQEE